MTTEEAVAKLNALAESSDGHYDNESVHGDADEVLLAVAPPEVRAAYERLQDHCTFWYA